MTRSNASHAPRRSQSLGFTLIEVLIVLAIVLALGGVVAYNLLPRREQAIDQTQAVQIDMFKASLKQFYLDFGRYPSEDEGIAVLWDKTRLDNEDDEPKWVGPYLEEPITTDHWGNEWNYRFPGEANEEMYELWSNGKDGEEDTEDDIRSWSEDDEFGEDFGTFEG